MTDPNTPPAPEGGNQPTPPVYGAYPSAYPAHSQAPQAPAPGVEAPLPQGGWQMGAPPENHLVWAILATLLCCWPVGLVAILRSAKVESLWFQGFPGQAHTSADQARKWAIWAAVIGLLCFVLAVVGYAALFAYAIQSVPINR